MSNRTSGRADRVIPSVSEDLLCVTRAGRSTVEKIPRHYDLGMGTTDLDARSIPPKSVIPLDLHNAESPPRDPLAQRQGMHVVVP
jgi:hypothetical protein